MDSREVLWCTLAKITERKAMQMVRRRRAGTSRSKISHRVESDGELTAPDTFALVEPTPEYRAMVKLIMAELIEKLKNPLWRQAVLLRLEGYSVPEIAAIGQEPGDRIRLVQGHRGDLGGALDGHTFLD